jgi:hypothetical protein
MTDLWQDEGFGSGGGIDQAFEGEDDWDEGEESIEADIEDGFDDPEELDELAAEDEDEDDGDD